MRSQGHNVICLCDIEGYKSKNEVCRKIEFGSQNVDKKCNLRYHLKVNSQGHQISKSI